MPAAVRAAMLPRMDAARSRDLAAAGTSPADPLVRICGEVAGAFKRKWGRGPTNTTAHWAGANMLVVLLYDGHTEQEGTIRAAGRIGLVLDGRQALQQLLEHELKAIPVLNFRRRRG